VEEDEGEDESGNEVDEVDDDDNDNGDDNGVTTMRCWSPYNLSELCSTSAYYATFLLLMSAAISLQGLSKFHYWSRTP